MLSFCKFSLFVYFQIKKKKMDIQTPKRKKGIGFFTKRKGAKKYFERDGLNIFGIFRLPKAKIEIF